MISYLASGREEASPFCIVLPRVGLIGFLLMPLHHHGFLPVQSFILFHPFFFHPLLCLPLNYIPASDQCILLVLRHKGRRRKNRKGGKMKHGESFFKVCI